MRCLYFIGVWLGVAWSFLQTKSLPKVFRLRDASYHGGSSSPLHRIVTRKKIEVDSILRRHQDIDDPLVMRMGYIASVNNFNLTRALKRWLHQPSADEKADEMNDVQCMSVTVDMKRRSPTIPGNKELVDYPSAGLFAEMLVRSGADVILVNTEELEYGGRPGDLKEVVRSVRATRPANPPPVVLKDIIIHPVQIAQALEDGASGVVLIQAVVGKDLGVLLDACTIMGTEAIVEVHSPEELQFALEKGATIFIVNNWDRMTGKLHKDQARAMASMIPINCVALAAGDISSTIQAAELGLQGYESVVIGRHLAVMNDIEGFFARVHQFRGAPRRLNLGMKGIPII